jgi:RNA polymerase sigma factor (sigma-70 family)
MAASGNRTADVRAALESLCRTYWPPLYAYVRRRGYSPEDAQDLTQEFFARLLKRNAVARVGPEKGRFRSFLLASMNHFLTEEWRKSTAQKRGGGKIIPINVQNAETSLYEPAALGLTPEQAYERRWAITLLEQVYRRLEQEYSRQNKAGLFSILRAALAGSSDSAPYAELAEQLEMGEGAVKVAVHRLRVRYRELLRDTIAETLSEPDGIDDELRYLFRVLARK